MKKIILLALLATFFITGCSTQVKYNKETDVSVDALTLLFSANDESKITVLSKFPENRETLVGDKEAYTDWIDWEGHGCFCAGICKNGCHKVTKYSYYNLGCLTEKRNENNQFDNTDQVFYTRYLTNTNWSESKGATDSSPYCGARKIEPNIVEESFSAIFEKRKDGKVLSYILKPSKRIVKSEWYNYHLPLIMEPDTTVPNNDQELQKKNRVMDYVLNYPVDLEKLMKESISVIYDHNIKEFTTKYDPVSMLNILKRKTKGAYEVKIKDERHDCHYILIEKDETDYKFVIDLQLCRINNTASEASLGKAYITLKNSKKVDLTNFSSQINKIVSFLK